MKLTKSQRETLRGMFGGRCAYCGCELPEKGWHADHVEPVLREWWKKGTKREWDFDKETGQLTARDVKQVMGLLRPEMDTLGNLFPCCCACNIDKHASSLEAWRKQMQERVKVCRRNSSAFRHAERFGMVQEIKKPIVFWFETFGASPRATRKAESEQA